jgi:hypothetical protein
MLGKQEQDFGDIQDATRSAKLRNRIISLFVCLGVFFLCSGCSAEKPKLESPLGTPAFKSPILPTAAARQSCQKLIQPKGNTVCGYIASPNGAPIVDRPIFLARGIFASNNSVVVAALDQATAPKGITDKNGMFYLTNVPSDLYFLMMGAYPKPMMLHEPANPANDLIVDWRKSGGVVDLGVIQAEP